jgi:glycine cleavage system aminomethyltransferase T
MDSAQAGALAHSPLEPVVVKAGATMAVRHGWLVAAHYGSPAGELALADSAVGLADRSDLGKFEVRGSGDAVDQLVGQLTGGHVDPGEALLAAGAWWCAVSDEHAVVVCDAGSAAVLSAALTEAARWTSGAEVTDSTARLAALGLYGPGTQPLLDELSSSEPPLGEVEAPALDATRLAAVPVMLLRSSPTRAVILCEGGRAAELWADVERAGRASGLGRIGAEAVAHLSPLAG